MSRSSFRFEASYLESGYICSESRSSRSRSSSSSSSSRIRSNSDSSCSSRNCRKHTRTRPRARTCAHTRSRIRAPARAHAHTHAHARALRSGSIAVAFLLNRFPGESLEELLCAVCPKRPRMLFKVNWWPNQVQSNFLRQLIDYEKTSWQSDTCRFPWGLHCASFEGSTSFDSGFEAPENPTLRLER